MSTHIIADHWNEVDLVDWPWRYFTPKEMRCRGTDRLYLERNFMHKLQELRRLIGHPLVVSSGYRSPEYDREVGGADVHPTGEAADLLVWGRLAHEVVQYAPALGFTGIGVSQKGSASKRFIHLDTLENLEVSNVGVVRPRPWIWSY